MKYLVIFILLTAGVAVIIKGNKLKKQEILIDQLEALLTPLKQHIPFTSVTGYCSNLPEDSFHEYYFKTTFIMAPAVLQNTQKADTILYLQVSRFPALILNSYQCIDQGTKGTLSYFLLISKS